MEEQQEKELQKNEKIEWETPVLSELDVNETQSGTTTSHENGLSHS